MKDIPLFYQDTKLTAGALISLSEDTARHIVQVLRMAPGALLHVTDGKGTEAEAIIDTAGKKTCTIRITGITNHRQPAPALHLAIAFTRNSSRNEWLLEKATELGVRRITPLITARSVRERIRADRWRGILVSAMIQSQQFFLPLLDEPAALADILQETTAEQKLIAHCMTGGKEPMPKMLYPGKDALVLIGPEGDFTEDEVTLATAAGCKSISLGATRLRTETAAMAACAVFHLINDIPA